MIEQNLKTTMEVSKEIIEEHIYNEDEQMLKIKEIIEGVARKYSAQSNYIEYDDLHQELWIVALKLIRDCGGVQNTNPKLVARSCFNKAVDYYRFHRRRYDSKAEYLEESGDSLTEKLSSPRMVAEKGLNVDGVLTVSEIIDLFPKDSRERKYVVAKLYNEGLLENLDIPDELGLPSGDTEGDFVRYIGYNSPRPASWGKKKYYMKRAIYEYLGKIPNLDNLTEEQRADFIRNRVENIFKESKAEYLNIEVLAKQDEILKIADCSEDEIWKSLKEKLNTKLVLRGATKDGVKFVMRNREDLLENSKKNKDLVFLGN